MEEPNTPNRAASPGPAGLAARVPTGDGERSVWESLRDTWLTSRIMDGKDMERNGAYGWEATDYSPIIVADEEGQLQLMFARDPELTDG